MTLNTHTHTDTHTCAHTCTRQQVMKMYIAYIIGRKLGSLIGLETLWFLKYAAHAKNAAW